MENLKGKKLLVLGGKPIGSSEIVIRAKELGVYTIVTDYLSPERSPAKRLANEMWDISTADVERLAQKAGEAGIDGIYAGVHEFNICRMIEVCSILGLPCYCTMDQWNALENKKNFKSACIKHDIPVTESYPFELVRENQSGIEFPVITKPADGSGSQGFTICHNVDELNSAYEKASQFSETGGVLVEKYMDYRFSVIINYTLIDGQVIYSGMSDKRSKKVFEHGAPIMSFQVYPSAYEMEYKRTLDMKTKAMLSDLGLKNGVVWIEAFCDKGKFTFNEMGFRFGGSLTYNPIKYFTDIDQLDLQLEYALTGKNSFNIINHRDRGISTEKKLYCILPTHVRPGSIKQIVGLDEIREKSYIRAVVQVHHDGDTIKEWGSAQQVFAYIHYLAETLEQASLIEREIMEQLHVYGAQDEEMLFNLYDETCLL